MKDNRNVTNKSIEIMEIPKKAVPIQQTKKEIRIGE